MVFTVRGVFGRGIEFFCFLEGRFLVLLGFVRFKSRWLYFICVFNVKVVVICVFLEFIYRYVF